MEHYNIVEIFSSINGEGQRAGQLALFMRMKGCNLDCSYCDTKWANEQDCRSHWTSTEEIIDLVRVMGIRNVTITGGEPLIQPKIKELLEELVKEPGIRVEIETNGSVDLTPFLDIEPAPTFNMDYKLPGSGMESQMCLDNLKLLRTWDTCKFVVGSYDDLLRAKELIDEYDLIKRCHVYFSPVFGKIEPEDIVNFMKSRHLNDVTLQLQIHKVIWDANMRGV